MSVPGVPPPPQLAITNVGCKFATELNSCISSVRVGHGHMHEPCTLANDYVVSYDSYGPNDGIFRG